jgi:sulfate transporter 4
MTNQDNNQLSSDVAKDTIQTSSTGSADDNASDTNSLHSSITTRHRANLNKINSDSTLNRRHKVPEPSPATLRKWSVPSVGRSMGAIPADNGDHAYDDDGVSGGERWAENVKKSCLGDSKTGKEWLHTLLPMTAWLSTYKWREYLQTDVMAGLTVGVMIIPQSMSYAKLAGLPVQFGLYSSLVPIYAYAFFGSSRQLAVGPVAMVSLLLSTGLTMVLENEGITRENNEDYDAIYALLALQTSVLVGICYIVMGLLRLGFVTIFLSHAVVSGFTSAAAIIIGLSQVKYIFGYDIPNDKSLHGMLKNIFANIDQFNWKTFLLGTSCVFTLVGLKKLAAKYPRMKWTRAAGPLLVTVISIVLQATIDLEARGIPIVKYIPAGLPSFTGNIVFPINNIGRLTVVILSIVIVGFMESIAIAKKLAQVHGYELDSSLELVGLGMANFTSGLFGGYPVTGSFSRSAVNNSSGAHSGLSAMVTASMVAITLLCLTSVFELMALCVLASIVISGVISLVDYSEAIYLWRVHKFDFSVWMVAFLGTLFLGVEMGLGISVGISLLLVIFESAYPHTAMLGRLPGTHQYRNIKQYPEAEMYDGIVLVRVDAPIYFANTQHIRDKVYKYYKRAEEKLQEDHTTASEHARRRSEEEPLNEVGINSDEDDAQRVKFIIWELNPVSHIDTSGLHTLQEMCATFKKDMDVQLCLTNPNPRVMRRLVGSGLADEIGRDHIFVSLHDAVQYCLGNMDVKEIEKITSRLSTTKLAAEDEPLPMNASMAGLPMSPIADVPHGIDENDGGEDIEVGLNI